MKILEETLGGNHMTPPGQNRAALQPHTAGRNLSKKQAMRLGLPWGPPPDLEAIGGNGYEAAKAFRWRQITDPPTWRDECPWPINTTEGRAWLDGWNRYCADNCLKDHVRLTYQ